MNDANPWSGPQQPEQQPGPPPAAPTAPWQQQPPTFQPVQYGYQGHYVDPSMFAPQPPRRRKKWLFAGIGLGVVVLLVAAGVVAWKLRSHSDGASSPENAALDALAAVESRDPLAFTDTVAAGELDGLSDVLESTHGKVEDAGLQDGGGVRGLLQGLSISTDDVHTETEQIRDDLAKVTFTGGSATVRIDPAEANVGIRDLISADADSSEETYDITDFTAETDEGEPIDPFVMTVKIDDRWYISPLYTAGEYASISLGEKRIDDPDLATVTYDSPEEAADGFLRAVAETVEQRDVTTLAESLTPHVGRAIATYRPVFDRLLNDDELDSSVTIDIDKADFWAETDGSRAKVVADSLSFTVTENGDTYSVEVSGDCIDTVGPDGDTEHACGDDSDLGALAVFFRLGRDSGGVPEGISATRDGDGWHVDPVATLITGALDGLESLTTEQLLYLIGVEGGAIEVYARADADDTLEVGETKTVRLQTPVDTGGDYSTGIAVLDMEVSEGDRIRISAAAPDGFADVAMVGSTGRVDYEADYDTDELVYEFSPDLTETVKIVVIGYDTDSVRIEAD